jgi:hypothetical protein
MEKPVKKVKLMLEEPAGGDESPSDNKPTRGYYSSFLQKRLSGGPGHFDSGDYFMAKHAAAKVLASFIPLIMD